MLRALISTTARVTRCVSRSRSNKSALFKRTLCSPKPEESDAEREVMFEKIEDTLNKLGFDRVKQHLERSSVNTTDATSQSAQGSKKKIVDKVRITLVSGSGGHGCVSFDRQRHKRVGAPNGGDGGRGGNVMFVVQSALPDLGGLLTAQQLTAPRGENGAASNRRGKNGADLRIGVPPGTLITEYVKRNNSDEQNEDLVLRPAPLEDWARDLEDMTLLERYPPGHDYIWTDGKLTRVSELTAQQERVIESRGNKTVARKLTQEDKHVIRLGQGTLLEKEGDFYLACRGGRGGLGNAHFASSINRSPETMTRGQIGETKSFVVELNLIADVGLIGFPNAGKSTLLQRLTRATPKIAPYPFTTLAPQLGTVMYRDSLGTQVRVADLPGLIQSAHLNRGLGIEFLRHVTRAKTLAVVLDMAGSESRSPWQDFEVLCSELEHYRPGLSKQIKLVIANKMDLPEASKHLRAFRSKLKERSDLAHLTLWALSAKEGGLELEDLAEHLKEVVHGAELEPEFKATNLLPHSEKLSREVHEQELLGFTDAERSLPDPELDGQKSSEPPKTKKKVASKKIKKINKSSK